MSSPPPKSSVPATMPTVWPPSNPSGTVIPFPLPWGQTGCCPPGGLDALMKCYCDLQQASAFIGQIMLDQINNNPAVIQAIIAALEASGSTLPLIGVTNGSPAQPGQVGEYVLFSQTFNYTAATQTQIISLGTLSPGDWDCWSYAGYGAALNGLLMNFATPQVGFDSGMQTLVVASSAVPVDESIFVNSQPARALTTVPTLIAFSVTTNLAGPGSGASSMDLVFAARRRR